METSSTPIQEYFGNSTIFIVGGTGFLGSLLIEKLLRTCSDLKKIYVLIRAKKGTSSAERLNELLDRPIFEKVKLENHQILNKIILVLGDCSLPNLGLSGEDLEIVKNEVNCIFYCAANLNFEAKFKLSVATNVTAVRDLIKIAKSMKDLKSIVYVSTAFFYGLINKDVVYEKVDDTNSNLPEQLQALCDNFDDESLEKFKQILIDKDTNIYTTTKWAAEILIKKIAEGLPVAVVRPTMITPTLSEPIPGWIDNFYGPIGLILYVKLGIIRVLLCNLFCKIDIIPADFVTNCMIAVAWDTFRQTKNDFVKNGTPKPSTVKIYNCASSTQNPITYEKGFDLFLHYHKSMPFSKQIFYDNVIFTSNFYMYYILKYILCIIPAHIIEILSYCIFKPTKITSKLKTHLNRYEQVFTFTLYDWNIRDDNVQILWKNLNDEDKVLYNFDVKKIDWNLYFKSFVEGVRINLLKDPMETVPSALKRRSKLKIMFYSINALIFLAFVSIIYLCLNLKY